MEDKTYLLILLGTIILSFIGINGYSQKIPKNASSSLYRHVFEILNYNDSEEENVDTTCKKFELKKSNINGNTSNSYRHKFIRRTWLGIKMGSILGPVVLFTSCRYINTLHVPEEEKKPNFEQSLLKEIIIGHGHRQRSMPEALGVPLVFTFLFSSVGAVLGSATGALSSLL